jgi:hypothetical protein
MENFCITATGVNKCERVSLAMRTLAVAICGCCHHCSEQGHCKSSLKENPKETVASGTALEAFASILLLIIVIAVAAGRCSTTFVNTDSWSSVVFLLAKRAL